MLAEILWLLNDIRANGVTVIGDDRTSACVVDSGLAARSLSNSEAEISRLGLLAELTRGSTQASKVNASCRLVVPFSVSEGWYPRSVEATLEYALEKSAGTRAEVSVRVNFAGFYFAEYRNSYPRGAFNTARATITATVPLEGDSPNAATLVRNFCNRPDYPVPVGVDVRIAASREGEGEALRVGAGDATRVTLRAGGLERCPDAAEPN